jgi:ankyrin repeat protein
MADNSDGLVVTEGMLKEAAGAGDLESLTVWAQHDVRVTCAEPLCYAAEGGSLEVARLLVWEPGADVNQAMMQDGSTPLILAAESKNLTIVRCLIELGAEVGAVDKYGDTALLVSAYNGH